jgi:TonB family protein
MAEMFDHRGQHGLSRRSVASLLASFGLHALLLALLVRAFAPTFVKTAAVRQGSRGASIALLYWPARQASPASASADDRSPARVHAAPANPRLTWRATPRKPPMERSTEAKPEQKNTGNQTQALLAGSPYGSLREGALTGAEVRPAIRVSGPNPVLSAEDLPEGQQGTVIVEVTIDERGNILSARVLQSLAPAIDAKVLTAVENWRFLPATCDGVAIASKQDVLYHFPR